MSTTPSQPPGVPDQAKSHSRRWIMGAVGVLAAAAGAGVALKRFSPGAVDTANLAGFWDRSFPTPDGGTPPRPSTGTSTVPPGPTGRRASVARVSSSRAGVSGCTPAKVAAGEATRGDPVASNAVAGSPAVASVTASTPGAGRSSRPEISISSGGS